MGKQNNLRVHVNSLFSSMCYAFDGVLIDPGDVWEGFNNVSAVLLTHAHFDHIYGLNELLKISPAAKVFTNEVGKKMLLNAKKNLSHFHESPFVFEYPEKIIEVEDGQIIEIGNDIKAKAMFTSGHSGSCISWIIGTYFFTGDSYIPGIKVATNLPGCNKQEAMLSEQKILNLKDAFEIYPGHYINIYEP